MTQSTLDDLFARMQEATQRREQEAEAERGIDTPWESARGNQHSAITSSSQSTAARRSQDCRCGRSGGIHLSDSPGPDGRRLYLVCHACNPRFACKKCDGSGHARRFNLATGTEDVVPFGCVCMDLEHGVGRLNEVQLPERYLTVDFSTLSYAHLANEQREKLTLLAEAAAAWCEVTGDAARTRAIEAEKPFLTFMGPVGTGKTHLATAVLRRFVLRHRLTGRFVDFSRFLADLRHCYSAKLPEEEVLGPLRTVDVLLLDELGKGRTENEWQLEKLDDLINSRYNAGRITLLTTNYLHGEFRYDPARFGMREVPVNESFWRQTLQERIGARMYDRLLEASEFLVFLGVDSYRRRMVEAVRT